MHKVTEENIDFYISKWHNGDSKLELHEFLGLTVDQYSTFLEKNELPENHTFNIQNDLGEVSYDMTEENVDFYVSKWHNGKSKLELHEYLGLSFEEYSTFVETNKLPENHKFNPENDLDN
jgi:beta-lactam-binding protein with PASTA domain